MNQQSIDQELKSRELINDLDILDAKAKLFLKLCSEIDQLSKSAADELNDLKYSSNLNHQEVTPSSITFQIQHDTPLNLELNQLGGIN